MGCKMPWWAGSETPPPDKDKIIADLRAEVASLKEERSNRWCPDVCPITQRQFFMWIEHPDKGMVPTYGGPFDSYTLAEPDDDGTFYCERYDHDAGGWLIDETVGISLRLIDDQREDHEYGTVTTLTQQLSACRQEVADAMRKNSELEQALQLVNGRVEMLRDALVAVKEQCIDGHMFTAQMRPPSHWLNMVPAALSNLNEDSGVHKDES